MVKTASYLLPKGVGGQQHDGKKVERVKYLNRVDQLNRIWLELNCPNPSRVVLSLTYAFMVTIGHT